MKSNAFKWTVIGGALAIIIMYGIDRSSAGIERVYGPIEGSDEYTNVEQTEQTLQPVDNSLTDQQQKIAQLERELKELKRLSEVGEDVVSPEIAEGLYTENERLPGLPVPDDQPTVNRLADSTSGLLQNLSSEGIRLVASLFDGLTK